MHIFVCYTIHIKERGLTMALKDRNEIALRVCGLYHFPFQFFFLFSTWERRKRNSFTNALCYIRPANIIRAIGEKERERKRNNNSNKITSSKHFEGGVNNANECVRERNTYIKGTWIHHRTSFTCSLSSSSKAAQDETNPSYQFSRYISTTTSTKWTRYEQYIYFKSRRAL